MKKIITTLILVFFSLSIFAASEVRGERQKMDPAKKAEMQAKFKEFAKENQKNRKELVEKIYQIRLSSLKTAHDKQLSSMNEINDLMDGIVFGEREQNKQIREKVKAMREAHKKELKEFRKSTKEEIKALRKEFASKQKGRRGNLKGMRKQRK